MHRIPDLNEHFMYFNDDVFLIRPTLFEDWFPEGQMALRGKWVGAELSGFEFLKSQVLDFFKVSSEQRRIGSKFVQLNAARLVGNTSKVFIAAHVPHPRQRSTLEQYFDKNPKIFQKNISFRFRSNEQFTSQSLINHIEIGMNGAAITGDQELVYVSAFRASIKKVKRKVQILETNKNIKFLCLQSLDQASPPVQKLLLGWIRNRTQNKPE